MVVMDGRIKECDRHLARLNGLAGHILYLPGGRRLINSGFSVGQLITSIGCTNGNIGREGGRGLVSDGRRSGRDRCLLSRSFSMRSGCSSFILSLRGHLPLSAPVASVPPRSP